MIRVVLFDLDGVLLPAQRWHFIALNKALERHGLEPIRDFAKYDGLPTRVKLDMLGVPVDLRQRVADDKQTETLRLIHQHAEPNIIHQHCMAMLKVDGFRIGIVSNAVWSTVIAALWKTGLEKFPDLVLSNEFCTKPKPDPEIYRKALDCMKIGPHEALAVEDNEKGVASSEGAGIKTVHVRGLNEVSYARLRKVLEC